MNDLLQVHCPKNNVSERKYIVEILLSSFLHINNFEILFSDGISDYVLVYNHKKIIFEDHFFSVYPNNLEYLSKKNIPLNLSWFEYGGNTLLPIIYGRNFMRRESDGYVIGLDIFASSFFLLTRWEEEFLGRDFLGKCDESKLFTVRHNIFKIPIVNLYLDLLVFFLEKIGYIIEHNEKSTFFEVKLTHDVDRMYLSGWKELILNSLKLFKKKKYRKSIHLVGDYVWYKLNNPNPFDTFTDFLEISKKINCSEDFYFKAVESMDLGYTYSINESVVRQTIEMLSKRSNVNIGFHPSEATFKDEKQFDIEYNRLYKVFKEDVKFGRNHELLCNVETLRQWESKNFTYISNYGFQYRNGFRCGVCFAFPLYDIYLRRQMKVMEIPFIVMDTVLLRNRPSSTVAFEEIKMLIDWVAKYKGIFCVNWHTNVFNMRQMQVYKDIYSQLINYVYKIHKNRTDI